MISLTQFGEAHGLVLEVNKRTHLALPGTKKYYAAFAHSETKDGHCLVGTHGNGDTLGEATNDYADKLRGKTLVIITDSDRREIQCPAEWGPA